MSAEQQDTFATSFDLWSSLDKTGEYLDKTSDLVGKGYELYDKITGAGKTQVEPEVQVQPTPPVGPVTEASGGFKIDQKTILVGGGILAGVVVLVIVLKKL